MDFIRANAGNIVVGAIVFTVLGMIIIRLISNARKGKSSCGCSCPGCAARAGCGKSETA